MSWSIATLSMVVSGLALVWVAFRVGRSVEGRDPLERVKGDLIGGRPFYVVVGLLLTGYGLFVATRTSGTWEVPVVLVLVPWLLIGWSIYDRRESSSSQRPRRPDGPRSTD